MSENKNFYITTTLPYLNAEPHIGFAAEIIRADVIARFKRLTGHEVFFNTGTDEHGLKIFRKAQEVNMDTQAYCDSLAVKFSELKDTLNLSFNNFIRTTDEHHLAAAQEFWNRCLAKGDIYKKNYQVKYCVGCELEKTESELVNGCCEFHPNNDLEIIEEENYFFRFSNYQKPLLDLYSNNPNIVVPHHRFTEIKNFVEGGLQDFSISRLRTKMPWGVDVPNDPDQVMYVWFDALINYISCLGWPNDEAKFKAFWPGTQVCGKDNLRQQTAMWQAMLLSAGLPNSEQVLIFGFITNNGQKMSKSLGNVVNPFTLVEKFGIDAVRYYFLREIQAFEDSDFSEENLSKLYNSDLANGLGNLAARTATLLEKNAIELDLELNSDEDLAKAFTDKMSEYAFNEALKTLWDKIKESDEFLSQTTPWKLTDREEIKTILKPVAQNILNISYWLEPFMPETARKIKEQFSVKQIIKGESLFPRLS
ncbi:MAG: methionine--tRNA ligase [Candidatus Falkowbacteria bacterium]